MNGENVHTVTVDYIEGVSVRADSYICSSLQLCVRSKFKERVFGLTVNGKAAKASAAVKNGDVLQFELRPSADSVLPMKPAAEEIPLSVLYEDEFTLILDKPTGLTVHPAPGHFSGTLVNGLLSYLKEEESDDFEDENRPGIVHRLDKDTSGVILTAKTRAAADYYASLFRERKVQKEYRAFLRGILPSGEGKIERRLVRHRRDRKRFTVTDSPDAGRAALTFYKELKRWKDRYSLVSFFPQTGRTHQLRVHAQSVGAPILGDPIYGRPDALFPEIRLMLHACRLTVTLFAEERPRTFEAALPPVFGETAARLDEIFSVPR